MQHLVEVRLLKVIDKLYKYLTVFCLVFVCVCCVLQHLALVMESNR